MISLETLQDAQKTLKGVARLTPLFSASNIGEGVYVKAENLQLTGSFKLRGAYYKISRLTPEEKKRGIIASSAGNHAQGVALSATKSGIKSTICIPAGAPLAKIEATKKYGADVVLVPGVFDDAYNKALELSKEHGYTFVHPFNDEYVISGQGTIGLEIIEQLPDVDTVIVPVGGGGLISGIAYAIKSLKPQCKVIGVQAENAPSMYVSIKNGTPTEVTPTTTIADGIIVKKPGDITFEMCSKYVDEIVTVNEDEISAAVLKLLETQKLVAEGSGAAPVAAVMFGKVPSDTNKKTVCVVSGGNLDMAILSRVINKGLSESGRMCSISTRVVDKPGHLMNLLNVISQSGANIVSINHSREAKLSNVTNCVVNMLLETKNVEHISDIENALKSKGYEII